MKIIRDTDTERAIAGEQEGEIVKERENARDREIHRGYTDSQLFGGRGCYGSHMFVPTKTTVKSDDDKIKIVDVL